MRIQWEKDEYIEKKNEEKNEKRGKKLKNSLS